MPLVSNKNQDSHFVITDARWLSPDGDWRSGWIEVRGSRIASAGSGDLPAELINAWKLSARGRMVAPGLIDIHIQGSDGFAAQGDVEQQLGLAGVLPRHGVTSYLAAVASAAPAATEGSLRAIASARRVQQSGDPSRRVPWQAEILGAHLESPFLSPEFRGAGAPAALRAPSIVELALWLEASERGIRMVTLVPELPGALEAIRWLSRRGIIADIGHTDATGRASRATGSTRAAGATDSLLTLDQVVRNLCAAGPLTPAQALRFASAVPARIIGVGDRKGAIAAGCDADLICLNGDLQVEWTMTRGTIAYERKEH